MDFGFSEQQERFRQELRDFYAKELPEDFDGQLPMLSKELQSFILALHRKAGEKGYLTPDCTKLHHITLNARVKWNPTHPSVRQC